MAHGEADKPLGFQIAWSMLQCIMCKFDFIEGEKVVACKCWRCMTEASADWGTWASPDLDEGCFSKEFVFHNIRSKYHVEPASKPHMCRPEADCRDDSLRRCFLHLQCYQWSGSWVTRSIHDESLWGFTPSTSHQRRRARYFVNILSTKLLCHGGWPRQLPCELWRVIASYLVRETAITAALGQDGRQPMDPCQLYYDTNRPVYASFIKIDGQRYIRDIRSSPKGNPGAINSLSSSFTNASDKSEFVCRMLLLDATKDCFFAVDAAGVRQLFAVAPHQREAWCRNYPTIPGAWWYREPNVGGRASSNRPLKNIYWQIPIANNPTIIDIGTRQALTERRSIYLRMRFFECNSPDITGYSVVLDKRGILLTIFSHKRDQGFNQPSLPVLLGLEDITDPAELSLVFMPLYPGEHITEIYGINKKCHGSYMDPPFFPGVTGILFSTDKGRTIAFGTSQPGASNIKRLVTMPPKPCRVFINELEYVASIFKLQFIAFEGDNNHPFPASQDALPTQPVSQLLPSLKDIDKWKYWYTSCSMKGASKIYPCVDGVVNSGWYQTLTGLLVEFADGHRDSVGWVRLDWLTEPIALDTRDNLYIRREGNRLFFEGPTFETQKPATQPNQRRLEVRQSETLEWCFSIRPRRNFLSNGHDDLGWH